MPNNNKPFHGMECSSHRDFQLDPSSYKRDTTKIGRMSESPTSVTGTHATRCLSTVAWVPQEAPVRAVPRR